MASDLNSTPSDWMGGKKNLQIESLVWVHCLISSLFCKWSLQCDATHCNGSDYLYLQVTLNNMDLKINMCGSVCLSVCVCVCVCVWSYMVTYMCVDIGIHKIYLQINN